MSKRNRVLPSGSYLALACLFFALPGASCDPASQEQAAPVSLQIRFHAGGAASATKEAGLRSFVALAAPTEADEITRILVDISHAESGLPLTTNFDLTQLAPGEWSGDVPLLPRAQPLRFAARALSAGGAIAFSGETLATLAVSHQDVEIPVAPAQDQQTLPMPRLVRLTYPAEIFAGQEEQIAFTLQGNAGAAIGLGITAAGSATPASEFSPASGAVTLASAVANFMTVFTAPAVAADTPFDYQVTITAAGEHGAVSITTNFRVVIKPRPASGPIVIGTRPLPLAAAGTAGPAGPLLPENLSRSSIQRRCSEARRLIPMRC